MPLRHRVEGAGIKTDAVLANLGHSIFLSVQNSQTVIYFGKNAKFKCQPEFRGYTGLSERAKDLPERSICAF
jgi:hypothetical protein